MTSDNESNVRDWDIVAACKAHTPAPLSKRQYLVCSAPGCKGWEWASDDGTCREPGCGAALADHSTSAANPKRSWSKKSAMVSVLEADLDHLEQKFPGIRAHVHVAEPSAFPSAAPSASQSAGQSSPPPLTRWQQMQHDDHVQWERESKRRLAKADIDQLEKKFPGIREHVQFALASQAPAEVRQLVNFPVWIQKGDHREAEAPPEDVHDQVCARDGAAGVGSHRHKSRSPRRQSSVAVANAQSEGRASLDLPAVNTPGASKSTRTKKSVKDEGPASKYAKIAADLQQQVHLAASQATSVSSQASPSN